MFPAVNALTLPMNNSYLVRLYCNVVDRTLPTTSALHVAFLKSKERTRTLLPSEPSYEELAPDFQSSCQFDELSSHCEDALPATLSKQELYVHAEEIATARKSGCAPTKRALTLIRGVLHARSQLKTSLSDRSVTLFNFHSTGFAEKLIQVKISVPHQLYNMYLQFEPHTHIPRLGGNIVKGHVKIANLNQNSQLGLNV